ncbi:hypothetical protein Tco_1523693, partial [Tanacetum coccineum]
SVVATNNGTPTNSGRVFEHHNGTGYGKDDFVFGACESSSSIPVFEQQFGSTTNYDGHTDNARRGWPGSFMGRYFMDDIFGSEYSGHKGPVILDFENSAVLDNYVSPLLSEKETFENVVSFKAKGVAYSCNDTSEYLLRRPQSVAMQVSVVLDTGGLSIDDLGIEQHSLPAVNDMGLLVDISPSQPVGDNFKLRPDLLALSTQLDDDEASRRNHTLKQRRLSPTVLAFTMRSINAQVEGQIAPQLIGTKHRLRPLMIQLIQNLCIKVKDVKR